MAQQINKTQAQQIIEQYHVNEEENDHAANYVLLAQSVGDLEAEEIARQSQKFIEDFGYADPAFQKKAHEACNHYFYEIREIANS